MASSFSGYTGRREGGSQLILDQLDLASLVVEVQLLRRVKLTPDLRPGTTCAKRTQPSCAPDPPSSIRSTIELSKNNLLSLLVCVGEYRLQHLGLIQLCPEASSQNYVSVSPAIQRHVNKVLTKSVTKSIPR